MWRNLGGEDRLFRLVLAFAVLPLALVLEGNARVLGLIGLEPLLVALIGWSPLYAAFGVNGHTAHTGPTPPGEATLEKALRAA